MRAWIFRDLVHIVPASKAFGKHCNSMHNLLCSCCLFLKCTGLYSSLAFCVRPYSGCLHAYFIKADGYKCSFLRLPCCHIGEEIEINQSFYNRFILQLDVQVSIKSSLSLYFKFNWFPPAEVTLCAALKDHKHWLCCGLNTIQQDRRAQDKFVPWGNKRSYIIKILRLYKTSLSHPLYLRKAAMLHFYVCFE